VPYLSTLEVCSRQGAIQIHVYLTLPSKINLFVAEFTKNTRLTTSENGSYEETTAEKSHHFAEVMTKKGRQFFFKENRVTP